MKFPNAAKGVKKIFTAEILNLIGTIVMVIAAIAVAIGGAGAAGAQTEEGIALALGGGMMVALILIAVYMILATIAYIMNLVGIINASKDETNFKSALIFLIVGIVTTILVAVFRNNPVVYSMLLSLGNLMNVFVNIFVIAGGVKLADRMNRGDVSTKGTNVLKLIIVVAILSLIASLISSFMGGMVASVTAAVLLIVSLILNIIKYFMYLSFLSRLKKSLVEG